MYMSIMYYGIMIWYYGVHDVMVCIIRYNQLLLL